MAYEKQIWVPYDDNKTEEQNIQDGAVVTAERMNHMESGLADHVNSKENPHGVTAHQVGALTEEETYANVIYQVIGKEKVRIKYTIDFNGKSTESDVPHVAKRTAGGQAAATSILSPYAFPNEFDDFRYKSIWQLDDGYSALSANNVGGISQELFEYDIHETVYRSLGDDFFKDRGSTDISSRVEVIKGLIVGDTVATLHGFGSGPSGNSLTGKCYSSNSVNWYYTSGTTRDEITQFSSKIPQVDIKNYIDSKGRFYQNAFAEPSDGSIGSTVNIDYARLTFEIEVSANEHIKSTIAANSGKYVTKEDVGLGSVTNVEQASKTDFIHHEANRRNPHEVTASQVGAYSKTESDKNYLKTSVAEDGLIVQKNTKITTQDWNTITDPGEYQVSFATGENRAGSTGILTVRSGGGFITQFFSNSGGVKHRVCLSSTSTWYAWTTLLDSNMVATQAEAEAGTSETAIMTPKATKQAIEKIAANTSIARKSFTGVSTIETSERGKFNPDGAIISFKRTGNVVLFNAKLNHTGGMKWVTNIMATGIPVGYRANKDFYETQFAIPLNIVPPKQTGTVIQWSRYTIDDDNIFIYSDNVGNHFITGQWLTIDPFPEEDIV